MKKFLNTCYKCGKEVKLAKAIKEGVKLDCLRCKGCGEEFFTSSELVRFDILTGRRHMIRKFGVLGDSLIMRFPTNILKNHNIKSGDYGVFEDRPDGILIRPVKASILK